MKRVRFTGERTGLPAISARPYGVITRGTVLEIEDEKAKAWVKGGDFEAANDVRPGTRVLTALGELEVPKPEKKGEKPPPATEAPVAPEPGKE